MPTTFVRLLKTLIAVLLPLVLIISPVQLLVTDQYLAFEYGKADFPRDPFGFDQAQRLAYASANFRYVREAQPLDALTGQRLGNAPLYNDRELKHMQDVQNVYQTTWWVWQVALNVILLAGFALAWRAETRPALAAAIKWGGLLTAGLVAVVGLLAIIAWRFWFVAFHQIFFTPGTWMFNYSDTLI
jgi:integral membrane protein (TIGR01906 family)